MIEHSPGDGAAVRSRNRYAIDQAVWPSVVVRRHGPNSVALEKGQPSGISGVDPRAHER